MNIEEAIIDIKNIRPVVGGKSLDMAIVALKVQIPMKAIKSESSSQACPLCFGNVNQSYCPNCGQKISY